MAGLHIVGVVQRFLASHRPLVVALFLVSVLLAGSGFFFLSMHENIAFMLPDDDSRAAREFRLLNAGPYTGKVFITLQVDSEEHIPQMHEAAERIASTLQPPLFSQVVTGPQAALGPEVFSVLLKALPSLFTVQDRNRLEEMATPSAIKEAMQRNYEDMLSLQGVAQKAVIPQDPLDMRSLVLDKLKSIRPANKVRVERGHFVSQDGRSLLLTADTPVSIIDSAGSQRLLQELQTVTEQAAGPHVRTVIVSGHRYAEANAERIKKDLKPVFLISVPLVLLVFFIFVRRRKSLYVLLIPGAAICFAVGGTALVYGDVSGITIGFGAVLLGITVDFGIHVYFALQQGPGDMPQRTARIAGPLLFAGATSMAAFAVLLLSGIQGIRQLGVFSLFGAAGGLLPALFVLPHMLKSAAHEEAALPRMIVGRLFGSTRPVVLVLWGGITVACLFALPYLEFNGDLRSLGWFPKHIQADEQIMREAWGDFRSKAMVFALGGDFQEALRRNDNVYSTLREQGMEQETVSLAGLLPSQEQQIRNRERWQNFWQDRREHVLQDVRREAGKFGFSEKAFAPFSDFLQQPPQEVDRTIFQDIGAKALFDLLKVNVEGQEAIVSLIPDAPEVARAVAENTDPDAVVVVSPSGVRKGLSSTLSRDFVRFAAVVFPVVAVFIFLYFRNVRKAAVALFPSVVGVLVVAGGAVLFGRELNLYSVVAVPLIIGLAADYGIFMVERYSGRLGRETERAVLVSGLSTTAGFGALTAAVHPALFSLGLTVLLGVGASVAAALTVIPALIRSRP